jgi:hypothetical protein
VIVSEAGSIRMLALARLIVRQRLRTIKNGLRARGRGRFPLLVTLLGVMFSLAYVELFRQAFEKVARYARPEGQVAALALYAGALAFASFAAKSASSEAVRAGSPENEFLLSRPVALSALVGARGLADALTDPVGALFLLPILLAGAFVWKLGAAAWPVAIATSMLVQVTISVLSYAAQVAVVRYVAVARRRPVWMALRLGAALALSMLWMLGTWVLRAPEKLGAWLTPMADWARAWPGTLVVAPLAALHRGAPGAALAALAALALVAVLATFAAAAVARRAGLDGWEEAGAGWADVAPAPGRQRPPTAATKDLRLIVRDRPQLMALVAMPVFFVGVQIFGAAGLAWSTETIGRVSFLAYSLAAYLATIGPLAHMQAERRAFWILRTVPVPLGRLLGAKARAWAIIVGATAAAAFVPLSFAAAGATALERVADGVLVVGGAAGMSFLAVAMAASGADLSDEQGTAVGPSTIYAFLLVGGLYNLVLVGEPRTRVAGLVLYAFLIWAAWRAGVERAELCMDPEAVRVRRLRVVDGALLLIVFALGGRLVAESLQRFGAAAATLALPSMLGFAVLTGGAAAIMLLRHPRARPARRGLLVSIALGLALGVALGLAARRLGPHADGPDPRVLAVAVLVVLGEELVFRGIVQRTLEEDLSSRGISADLAATAAAVATVALAAVAAETAGGVAARYVLAHATAATTRALTGRATPAWLTRATAMVVLLG